MEQRYLIDTNIIIYHLNGMPEASMFIDNNFKKISISFVTYIEVLSFTFENKEIELEVKKFLNLLKIIKMNNDIIEKTIDIRKKTKIKLPDAIIAATAEIENITLVTRNIKDFKSLDINFINIF